VASLDGLSRQPDGNRRRLGGLAIYIGAIRVDFEVIEPPELVDELRVLADRFQRAAVRRAS
jgi:hypothetical protein